MTSQLLFWGRTGYYFVESVCLQIWICLSCFPPRSNSIQMSIQWIGRCSTQPQPTSLFSGQFWDATMLDLLPPGKLWYVITTRMMWNICRQVTGNPNLNLHVVGNPYSKVTNEGLAWFSRSPKKWKEFPQKKLPQETVSDDCIRCGRGGWSKGHPH